MPRSFRHRSHSVRTGWVLVVGAIALMVGCSANPGVPARRAPGGPSAVATVAPAAVATARPTAGLVPADGADGCVVSDQSFTPPTVRLEDVAVETAGDRDRIVFKFGPGEVPDEAATIGPVEPPFFEGQSTNEIEVAGDRHVRILFRDMLQEPAAGEVVFVGERNLTPDFPGLKQLVVTDEFEAVMEWIAGYDGGGCVSLIVDEKGGAVSVEIEHGPGG